MAKPPPKKSDPVAAEPPSPSKPAAGAAPDKNPRVGTPVDDPALRPIFKTVLPTPVPGSPGKWVVVLLHIQGEDIVDRELLCRPTDRAFAMMQAQAEFLKHVIAPLGPGKVKA